MKTSTCYNSPAEYNPPSLTPGHHTIDLVAEDRIEGLFLQLLYAQLPKLPQEQKEQRIDRVYVVKPSGPDIYTFNPEKKITLVLPFLSCLMADPLKNREFPQGKSTNE